MKLITREKQKVRGLKSVHKEQESNMIDARLVEEVDRSSGEILKSMVITDTFRIIE